jgi:hypothetical protein
MGCQRSIADGPERGYGQVEEYRTLIRSGLEADVRVGFETFGCSSLSCGLVLGGGDRRGAICAQRMRYRSGDRPQTAELSDDDAQRVLGAVRLSNPCDARIRPVRRVTRLAMRVLCRPRTFCNDITASRCAAPNPCGGSPFGASPAEPRRCWWLRTASLRCSCVSGKQPVRAWWPGIRRAPAGGHPCSWRRRDAWRPRRRRTPAASGCSSRCTASPSRGDRRR